MKLALVLAALLAWTSPARAQDQAVFDDASPGVWAFASFELVLAGAYAITSASERPPAESWCRGGCLVAGYGLALGIPIATGVIAAVTDAHADAPFVFQQTLWGGATALLLGAGTWMLVTGALPKNSVVPAVVAGLFGAVAMGVYAFLRREQYARDPALSAPAHVMTWAPPPTIGLVFSMAALLQGDGPAFLTALAPGIAGLLLHGIPIAFSEATLARR